MKSISRFIVSIPKKIQDTITTDSGLELYVDNRFNEFEHRSTSGEVVSSPLRYDTGVKEGTPCTSTISLSLMTASR